MLVENSSHGKLVKKRFEHLWSFEKVPFFSSDTETRNIAGYKNKDALVIGRAEVTFFSICFRGEAYSFPTSNFQSNYVFPEDWAWLLSDWFMDKSIIKVFHNANYDTNQFYYNMGIPAVKNIWDTVIGAWKASEWLEKGLKERAPSYGRYVRDTKSIDFSNLEQTAEYAEQDAVQTDEMFQMQYFGFIRRAKTIWHVSSNGELVKTRSRLPSGAKIVIPNESLTMFDKYWIRLLELPVLRATIRAERRGFPFDIHTLQGIRKKLSRDVRECLKVIYRMAGRVVNLNSNSDLTAAFDELDIDNPFKTKKGAKTFGAKALHKMKGMHPFVDALIKYKGLEKMVSVYVGTKDFDGDYVKADCGLEYFVNRSTGAIHCNMNTVAAVTGRNCIAEGSLISTLRGNIPIEKIKVNDVVYCYDEKGRLQLSEVSNTRFTGIRDCVEIFWESTGNWKSGSLVLTPEHLCYSLSRGWTQARYLRLGEKIYHVSRSLQTSGRIRVYGAKGFYRDEARFIGENYFGVTSQAYQVHHRDENPSNNKLTNLKVLFRPDHVRFHTKRFHRRHPDHWKHMLKGERVFHRGKDSPLYICLSRFQLLRLIAISCGRPTYSGMDFNTFKGKCRKARIDLRKACRRYGADNRYLSKGRILSALSSVADVCQAAKILRIGTRLLKEECFDRGLIYANHSIVSVKRVGKYCVYDLSVRKYNNFIAQELCVHNSSTNPNLQQIPARKDVYGIKKCFVGVAKGTTLVPKYRKKLLLLVLDYGQLEIRVMCLYCKDPTMTKVLRDPEGDIHAYTAEQFGVSRRDAKDLNFLLLYGGQEYMLSETLTFFGAETTIETALAYRQSYDQVYSRVSEFRLELLAEHKDKGCVRLFTGRKRTLPDIDWGNTWAEHKAETTLSNNVVQGAGQDFLKAAIVRSDWRCINPDRELLRKVEIRNLEHKRYLQDKAVKLEKLRRILRLGEVNFRLQVHDEMILTCLPSAAPECLSIVANIMSWRHYFPATSSYNVPVVAEGAIGENWKEAKDGGNKTKIKAGFNEWARYK
jgi:DNA polymerase I-like protein with 3'-5' exonuclease and polymerase domains